MLVVTGVRDPDAEGFEFDPHHHLDACPMVWNESEALIYENKEVSVSVYTVSTINGRWYNIQNVWTQTCRNPMLQPVMGGRVGGG